MNFNGKFGIVLVPDAAAAEQALLKSKRIESNLLQLGGRDKLHMTLYHADFENLPEAAVDGIMQAIAAQMPTNVQFYQIATYSEKFVFWDARPSGALISLHKQALGLAAYFKEGAGAVGTEGLDLSDAERENIRRYGNPLVGDLWRPHVTLGYREKGSPIDTPTRYNSWFRKLAFVQIGQYGTAQVFLKTLELD